MLYFTCCANSSPIDGIHLFVSGEFRASCRFRGSVGPDDDGLACAAARNEVREGGGVDSLVVSTGLTA